DSRPVAVTPQLRQLLELPTNQVRRRTGLGAGTIKKLRDELGIRRLTVREWRTRLVEQRLGKVPDEALAEELGVSPNTVAQYRRDRGHYQTSHQRWTPEEDAMLGKLSDEEVARRTGHPLGSVSKRRRQLGHVRFRSRAWEPEEVALLGKLPDREVAKRIGRSLGAVRNKRYALGLPASETSAARVPPAFV
ncbi:MAG TPA: hypothetical protein VLF66_13865, partial [Thermoanaerobaculia bacterium]|nr:hypothetical protein [Thermoanaerobaculia bacterium]